MIKKIIYFPKKEFLVGYVSMIVKHTGEEVRKGDVIMLIREVRSSKNIVVSEHGKIRKILVKEGDRVSIGDILAQIET